LPQLADLVAVVLGEVKAPATDHVPGFRFPRVMVAIHPTAPLGVLTLPGRAGNEPVAVCDAVTPLMFTGVMVAFAPPMHCDPGGEE
jgi:hypothetical protein